MTIEPEPVSKTVGEPEKEKPLGSPVFTKEMEAAANELHALSIARNKEIGKILIQEAAKQYDADRQAIVVGSLARLMSARDESRALVDKYLKAVAWYDKKLKAIENGEFEWSIRNEIVPNDPDLQRANY
jgi:hypothetical protein